VSDYQPIRFQLSYGDCDTVGIAYFAIYYPWM
jgi:acyl-CoA thioesterase FadM